ncbi:hypothetical protein BIU88_02240 [Chlorobaculum limnaeum]|uniref:Cyclic nucleotide-binding protein n=1 Tax=Chlorobaculum limnaeum TaxID=274537 RepID=A0A1D8D2K3_CHLLM|nr:DUF1003 domain-containing protein [Chlorobaculum limnaeum]AOS83067.1 hypothetical protein BIU88_02240 [Chlorobaculum limnaeum]
MTATEAQTPECQICGTKQRSELRRAMIVRPAVSKIIQQKSGNWDENGWICMDDLQQYQHLYVQSLLEEEKGELTELDKEVIEGLRKHEILAANPDIDFDKNLTLGQRLADNIASFGGSWKFIIIFGLFIAAWMGINIAAIFAKPFDPYPFILLNLVLSTLAAIQAPVIMMSQNRQEERDRQRAIYDYKVNLKAELEIRQLHQKVDHLLSKQWERLVEIQEIQMELINELREKK